MAPDAGRPLWSIRLREWERCFKALPDAEIAALASGEPRVVDVRPRFPGDYELIARHWVGAGRFHGLDLQIAPKIPATSVLALIGEEVERLRVVDADLLGAAAELQELIGHAFVSAVIRVCRRGLRRDYVQREETLAFARGRIDVRLTSLEHMNGRARISCVFEEFEQDGPANRALASAIQRILHRPTLFSEPLRRRAAEAARRLPLPSAIAPSAVGRLSLGSRDPFYRAALRFAELVLRGLGASDDAPGRDASGFWVDMHGLFQAFVARSVRSELQGLGCVVSSEPERHLDEERRVLVIPDVLVRLGGAELPIDAKYKAVLEPENSDVYQVLAYCRALGSPAGIIVVPGDRPPHRIRCQGGEVIWMVTLDLRSREAMAASARALAQLAFELVTAARTPAAPRSRSPAPPGAGPQGIKPPDPGGELTT